MKCYCMHYITYCKQQVCKNYRAFKRKRSSVVSLAPAEEKGTSAAAFSGLGMFSQACSSRPPEPLLQPPCLALGPGCRHGRAYVLSARRTRGVVPLVADTAGVSRPKGMNF